MVDKARIDETFDEMDKLTETMDKLQEEMDALEELWDTLQKVINELSGYRVVKPTGYVDYNTQKYIIMVENKQYVYRPGRSFCKR